MPKDNIVLSESDIEGYESIEEALRTAIRQLQQGLCNIETHLLAMIEADEVDATMWLKSHECNVELKTLINELIDICRTFRPSTRTLKEAKENIDTVIKEFEKSGLNP